MNPYLEKLQPYPFEKLAQLKGDVQAPRDKSPITLAIGEPQHPTPHFITEAVIAHLHGLVNYPATRGLLELRIAIAEWLAKRFQIPVLDADKQILPVNGTREALFSFAQCVIDPNRRPLVLMPNPFYQIYEGAALLAGAEPYYLNSLPENHFLADFEAVPEAIWRRCQLLYLCSPGNPTGAVIPPPILERLISLAERFNFVIASDECYSEIYLDESQPPPGLLQVAYGMGNDAFKNCIVFHSLSKRSNAPGLRSGFVAGDAAILQRYYRYRTYHGCSMPLHTQHASRLAWQDEAHVRENRAHYREKFKVVCEILKEALAPAIPPAGFYLWPQIPLEDTEFTRRLFAREHVTVLPGRFLSRESGGVDPGRNRVRIALVEPLMECAEAANRIKSFLQSL